MTLEAVAIKAAASGDPDSVSENTSPDCKMNSLVLTLGLCVCLAAGALGSPTTMQPEEEPTIAFVKDFSKAQCDTETWNNFKIEFKKGYQNSTDEEQRQKIFCDNLRQIIKHNADYDSGKESYRKGVNEFSDLTQEEWAKTYLMPSAK